MASVVASVARGVGRILDGIGHNLQGRNGFYERLVKSSRVVRFNGQELQHDLQAFVAPTANVLGAVTMGNKASIWYGAVVKGDTNAVTIGRSSSVGDRAVVDATAGEVKIGADVTIGPAAYVEACDIHDGVMIAAGAKIMAGCVIGSDSYIDGGAILAPNTRVAGGEVWSGSPATKVRNLTADEMAYMRNSAAATFEVADEHYKQSIKTRSEIIADEHIKEVRDGRFLRWDEPLPQANAIMTEYNKLSENHYDTGIFRVDEYDSDDEIEAVEKAYDEHVARQDAEAEEYARLDRVGDAVEQLSRAHPADYDRIRHNLFERDEKAAAILEEMLRKVGAVERSETKAATVESIIQRTHKEFTFAPKKKEEDTAAKA